MAPASLFLSAGLGLAASASFALVGMRLGRRAPAGDAGIAHRAFRVWWGAASAYALLVGVVLNLAAFAGWTPLAAIVTGRQLSILVLAFGIAALLHYVSFLWTGWARGRALWVGVGFAIYAIVAYAYAGSAAVGVRVGPFDTRLAFSPAPDPSAAGAAFAALTVPELAAAVALLALATKLDAAARRRVLLVGASLLAWFAASLFAAADPDAGWVLARPVLGLVAAVCALLAYAPPRAVEAWVERADERQSAMAARMRQLV